MSIGRITVDLLLKAGSFESDLNRASKHAAKRAKEIDEAFARAGKAIAAGLTVAAGAAALAFQNTVNRMDELSKAAQRAQMPTEEFSRLAYAADLADVSMGDLQSAFGRLAKAQGDALKGTGEQAEAFKALGIQVANADGTLRKTTDVFAEFADKFQQYQGSPEIVAAGMRLFGRSFQNLIPLLKDGAEGLKEAGKEADSFGVTLSTEAGQAAERFNDNITRLQASIRGLAMTMTAGLLPALNGIIEKFLDARAAGLSFGDALDVTANIKGFGTLEEKIALVKKKISEKESGKWTGLFSDESLADLKKQLENLLALKNRLIGREMAGAEPFIDYGAFTPLKKIKLPTAGQTAKAPRLEQADLTDEQRTLIDAIGLYKDIEQRAKDYGATLQWLDRLYFDNAISAEQYDVAVRQLTKSTESLGRDGVAAIQAQANAWLDQIDPMRVFIRHLEKVDEIVKAMPDGFFTPDQIAAIKALGSDTEKSVDKADDAARSLGMTFNSAFEDAIIGGEKLRNVLSAIGQDIARIFIRKAISEPFTNFLVRSLGLGGGLSMRADGGPVSAGKAYLVGEEGPELIVPRSAGTVIPNGAGGQSVTINQTISVGSGVSRADVVNAMSIAKEQAKREVYESMRRGGVFA